MSKDRWSSLPQAPVPQSTPLARAPNALLRQIFEAEDPALFVKQLSAQVLFHTIRFNGIASCAEVIELLSPEQFQSILDFDLWTKDVFEEERIWDWLELPDVADDISFLQKFLQSVDLKLIAILINRHVEVFSSEEATEAPPDHGFYSPDKGQSWVRVSGLDSHCDFLLKRLLALLFESHAELYYQLLQIPCVRTESDLEEQGFQEKSQRLASEGIPDLEWASELHSPINEQLIMERLRSPNLISPIEDIAPVPVFMHTHSLPEPLRTFFQKFAHIGELEAEVTLLVNSAVVHFNVPIYETSGLQFLIEQIRGAMNIGLEKIQELSPQSSHETILQTLGIRGVYRLGLASIFHLRILARKISEEDLHHDPRLLAIHQGLVEKFPYLPLFLEPDGTLKEEGEKLEPGNRPIQHLSDIAVIELLFHPFLNMR
ncbi:MAG: hypothetical protein KDD60_05740 [Bdellovibrionales bacterium]|nr:hypothetical protein [Bdellovibrionales bacterium]